LKEIFKILDNTNPWVLYLRPRWQD
jgi:hypothetical protein